MWKHREPSPEDYSSDEEYRAALEAYNIALDNYVDDYIERRRAQEEK